MSGSGSLTKQNAGTLILTGANTYSGGTTVSAGTLQGNTSSLQGAITNNSNLVFNQSGAGTFAGTITGSGSTTIQNTADLLLSGTISNSSATTVTSSLPTLTNTGSMTGTSFGISNSGAIATFNNAQGASSNALIYTARLPINYNVIINSPTNYGKLAGNNITNAIGTSGITFNIYGNAGTTLVTGVSASTIAAGTYTSVLTGLTSSNIVSSSLSGTYTGGYTWQLVSAAGTTWNLVVASSNPTPTPPTDTTSVSNITAGTTVSVSSLGSTYNPVLSGGTLVLNTGDSSSTSILVTSAGSVIQSPSSGSATLSGALTGAGGLTFTGTGTIILTGTNTYSGGTTVSSGTLSVAGVSPTGTGDVLVASAGTLMGTGTIAGNGIVSGVLKPGNSPGYLSFAQNLTLNAGSTYQQDIAGATQASSASPVGASGYYSFVNVGSQLTITSGATLTPRLSNLFSASEAGYGSGIHVPVLGDRFRILAATGGISGRFSTLTQPAELSSGTQFLPFYNMMGSNSLDLVVIPSSYVGTVAAASGNANAQSVGSVLTQSAQNSLVGTATEAQEQLLYSISRLTSAQSIVRAAQSLAGEVYAATIAVIAPTTQRVQQTVLSRLGDTAGLGAPGALMNLNSSVNNTTSNLGVAPSAAVSSNPNVNPHAEVKALSNGNVWGDLAYQRGNRASDNQSGGWNSNLYQLTFGSDFYSSNGTTLGGGFALSSTTINPVYGSATVQQGSLFAYGKMPVEAFVVDAMASIGLSSSDITRGDITGLSNSFKNKTVMGNDALISLGLSRPIDLESVRVTPYARVTWQIATQSAVNEGGAASALNVDRYTGNGVRGVIGVAAGSLNKDPFKEGYTYRANIGVGADTTGLLNPNVNTTLVGYTGNVTTPNAGAAFVQAGLYGTAKIADNAFAYAGVSAEARSGQTLYGGSVGLRIAF
jgi:autotransporter-associated beta strand protein